ncbi:MAG: acyl carrier protein [Lachnospiraceae bacterium]|uniref:Acyl carrier protein n=2 Tax=Roseburia yibonii TaxID=2763063 RepID=A0ABR7I9E3_9FIRM|nr:acyl carrier protein [Roseburia yibonii]MCI5876793.1 acyl carrier protein [Lachnospiraceae bacterium]
MHIMLEKLAAVIREQLNLEDVEITEKSNFKDDLGADSLDLFELVMSLEEEFGVEIPSEDLEKIATVGDVVNYLKEHGVEE